MDGSFQVRLVGINQSAPMDIREKAAIGADRLAESLSSLRSYIPQGVILSTCNRTEIYTVADNNSDAVEASIPAFLKDTLGIPAEELSNMFTLCGISRRSRTFTGSRVGWNL